MAITSDELARAKYYVDRKLSGKRINVPENLRQAYTYLINQPEALRQLSARIGRGEGTGIPLHGSQPTSTSIPSTSTLTSTKKTISLFPTYDAKTKTFTDTNGLKYSMTLSNAIKQGAVIQNASNSEIFRATLQSKSKSPLSISSGVTATGQTIKPVLVVSAYQRQKGGKVSETLGLGALSDKIRLRRGVLHTAHERSLYGQGEGLSALGYGELYGLTALGTIVDFGKGVADLPETAYRLVKNPSLLKEIPKSIDESGKEFGDLIRTSPGEAFIVIGTNVLLLKGSDSALNKVSNSIKSKATKLSPKYVGEAKIGSTLKIPVSSGKKVDLKVVGRIPKATLKKQVSLAGKKVNAISSQADKLLTLLKRSKTVKKPIPGEAGFSRELKSLLKKFDDGKLKAKDIPKINDLIKKEGAKGILERSFFADPTGKIRPSRLGVGKEKSVGILDYLTEDITLKKAKPQILFFENVKVQNLPKTLKKIGDKLKKGITLTKKEGDELIKFQLTQSNKFKPLGFISGESEITLAPGEILKKSKTIGKTVVKGKVVPIVKTEVLKPTGKLKDLLKKYNTGKLSKGGIKELDKILKKKTGFNYGLSSSKVASTGKYVDIKKIGVGLASIFSKKKPLKVSTSTKKANVITVKRTITPYKKPKSPKTPTIRGLSLSKRSSAKRKTVKKVSVSKAASSKKTTSKKKTYSRPIRRKTSRSPVSYKRPISPKKPISPKSPKKPYSPYSPKRLKKPVKSPPKIIPPTKKKITGKKTREIRRSKTKTPKRTGKQRVGYIIKERRGGRFFKVKGEPLSITDARDRLAFRLDNRISRTARLVKVKTKRLGKLRPGEKGYFNRYKKNLRNYKIIKGRRVKTPLQFIEKKGRGVISTKGEKRQLALNRRMKKVRAARKTKTKSRKK